MALPTEWTVGDRLVTAQDIKDLAITAFEGGGCNHWAAIRYETNARWYNLYTGSLGERVGLALLGDHTIYLEDREDSETTFELTIQKMVKGIEGYYQSGRNYTFEEMDAKDTDIIVQLGVHNEIVYG